MDPSHDDIKYAKSKNWSDDEIADDVENFVEHFTNGKGRNETRPEWSKSWKRWVRTNYAKNGMNGSKPMTAKEKELEIFGRLS